MVGAAIATPPLLWATSQILQQQAEQRQFPFKQSNTEKAQSATTFFKCAKIATRTITALEIGSLATLAALAYYFKDVQFYK